MIGMIDRIGSIRTMIGILMGRLEGEPRFMIGWGVDSVCMTDLVSVSGTFPRCRRKLVGSLPWGIPTVVGYQ